MASLSVRKIDEETLKSLRIQAASHGVSMEEEVRQIIKKSVTAQENLGDMALRLFSPCYEAGSEGFQIPARESHEPLQF